MVVLVGLDGLAWGPTKNKTLDIYYSMRLRRVSQGEGMYIYMCVCAPGGSREYTLLLPSMQAKRPIHWKR